MLDFRHHAFKTHLLEQYHLSLWYLTLLDLQANWQEVYHAKHVISDYAYSMYTHMIINDKP